MADFKSLTLFKEVYYAKKMAIFSCSAVELNRASKKGC
jgi:hypothetical protein